MVDFLPRFVQHYLETLLVSSIHNNTVVSFKFDVVGQVDVLAAFINLFSGLSLYLVILRPYCQPVKRLLVEGRTQLALKSTNIPHHSCVFRSTLVY